MKTPLFLFLFLVLQMAQAQNRSMTFDEEFNDNEHQWVDNDNEMRSAKIENGRYYIAHLRDKDSWYFWNRVPYLATNKDFSIECKFRVEEGAIDQPYGLLWGLRDAYNLHAFMLSANGFFKIHSWVDSQYVSVKPWTKHSAIHPKGKDNTIVIEGVGGSINYYINDSLVFRQKQVSLYGSNLGFSIEKRAKVSVDYVKMWQDTKLNLVSDAIQGRKKEDLGPGVNTKSDEIMPFVSADGKKLYFVRKKYEKNLGPEHKDDVWVSYYDEATKRWGEAINFGAPINNNEHNQVIFVSPDGQTMVLGNRYRPDGSISGKGLSLTKLVDGKWINPEPIEIEDFSNKDSQHAYGFSPNRKVLLLAIHGKECYGYKDIYVSFQLDEKHYSKPINLGPVINTYLDETTPFLASDGKTMYFSSEGHFGYGSADVFVSRRLDDTWTNWTTPQNLGPEINSSAWDAYYSLPASGKMAIMAASTDKLLNADLMKIETSNDGAPEPVGLIGGRVFHALNKTPLDAEISFQTGLTHEEVALSHADAVKGAYQVVLPRGKVYQYLALRKGFYAGADALDLSAVKEYEEINKDIYLYPIEKNVRIPLPIISFDKDGKLSNEAEAELDRLSQLLQQYPDMKVKLEIASDNSNTARKQNEALKNYLNKLGLTESRVKIESKSGTGQAVLQITSLGKEETPLVQHQGDFDGGMDVKQLKEGQRFRIQNLYFMADSSSFTNNSVKTLDELAGFLLKNPNIKIEVGGHTNGLPAHAYCDRLSDARAGHVAEYLYAKGVPKDQVTFKGYGKRMPVADNSTDFGRRQNQRVEVKVLKL